MADTNDLTEEEFCFLTCSNSRCTEKFIQTEALQRHCPLDNSRQFDAKNTPHSKLARTLPLELTTFILDLLDLRSLTDMRGVNHLARTAVDSLLSYRTLIERCPDLIRALLSTRMAVYFTARDVLQALCTQSCGGCGRYGAFVDLFTCRRYCNSCITYGPVAENLSCMLAPVAGRKYKLSPDSMRSLPTMSSIPGPGPELHKGLWLLRTSLVRVVSAVKARDAQQKEQDALYRKGDSPKAPTRGTPTLDSHLPRGTHQGGLWHFRQFMRLPFLDNKTGSLDWGVTCQACDIGPTSLGNHIAISGAFYTVSGYHEHFKNCKLSQARRVEMR